MQEGAPTGVATPSTTPKPAGPAWVLAVMACIILVLVVAATYLVYQMRNPHIPPRLLAAQKAVDFPLYYPNKLPAGYKLEESSITYTKHVAVYSFTYEHGKHIAFSVQPKAAGFSTDSFNPTSEFTSYIGRAYLVDLDDRSSAAVDSDTSWLLINDPELVPAALGASPEGHRTRGGPWVSCGSRLRSESDR